MEEVTYHADNQSEFSKSEAAKFLNVSEATLRNWERYFNLHIERKKGSRIYTRNTLKRLKHIQTALEQYGTLEDTKRYLMNHTENEESNVIFIQPETPATSFISKGFGNTLLNVSDVEGYQPATPETGGKATFKNETLTDNSTMTLLIKELSKTKDEALNYANQAIEYAKTAGQVKLLEDLSKNRETEYFKMKYENEQLQQQLAQLKKTVQVLEDQVKESEQDHKTKKWYQFW